MPNATKIERVAELKEQIESANALLLTEYRGLTVEEITELRRSLRDVEASLAVIKNTLMQRAANDAGIAELDDLLVGPSAIAFVGWSYIFLTSGWRYIGFGVLTLVAGAGAYWLWVNKSERRS